MCDPQQVSIDYTSRLCASYARDRWKDDRFIAMRKILVQVSQGRPCAFAATSLNIQSPHGTASTPVVIKCSSPSHASPPHEKFSNVIVSKDVNFVY